MTANDAVRLNGNWTKAELDEWATTQLRSPNGTWIWPAAEIAAHHKKSTPRPAAWGS